MGGGRRRARRGIGVPRGAALMELVGRAVVPGAVHRHRHSGVALVIESQPVDQDASAGAGRRRGVGVRVARLSSTARVAGGAGSGSRREHDLRNRPSDDPGDRRAADRASGRVDESEPPVAPGPFVILRCVRGVGTIVNRNRSLREPLTSYGASGSTGPALAGARRRRRAAIPSSTARLTRLSPAGEPPAARLARADGAALPDVLRLHPAHRRRQGVSLTPHRRGDDARDPARRGGHSRRVGADRRLRDLGEPLATTRTSRRLRQRLDSE